MVIFTQSFTRNHIQARKEQMKQRLKYESTSTSFDNLSDPQKSFPSISFEVESDFGIYVSLTTCQ